MKKNISLVMLVTMAFMALLLFVSCPQPVADVPPQDDPDPEPIVYSTPLCGVDGRVNDLVLDGHTLYLAGNFNLLGEPTGCGMPVLSTTGKKPSTFVLSKINGVVYAAVPDGSGGWYIGGTFTMIGDTTRNGLARINADGSLHAWNPNPLDNGDNPASVRAIFVYGDLVYVGGTFWKIGGQLRRLVAAIDADGNATSWDPNPNMFVVDGLFAVGTKLYVLGDFINIAGTTKSYLAAFSLTDGSFLASGAPNVTGRVLCLAFDSTYVYAVGDFSEIGGVSRSRIARFLIDGNTVDAGWYPTGGANNTCYSVLADTVNGKVFVGGSFSQIGGVSSPSLAAILIADASVISNGTPTQGSASVFRLVSDGSVVYAGGGFRAMNSEARLGVAAFDPVSGDLLSWNPGASRGDSSIVFALAVSGGQVYIGGDVAIIGGVSRQNLAAIDLLTGLPTAWNPGADAPVNSIKLAHGVLYALGGFGKLGGANRQFLGAVSLSTGLATAFAPEPDLRVYALAFSSDRIYAGGEFTEIGGEPRSRLAALSPTDGQALAWAPVVEDFAPDDASSIEGIAISGSVVYVAGWFPSINGTPRDCLAALDASSGAVLSWDPFAEAGSEPDNGIRHVFVYEGSVYIFGYFTALCSQTRNSAAAFSASSGALLDWNPDLAAGGNSPWKVSLRDGVFYIAGGFNTVGGEDRLSSLAAITTGGTLLSWSPAMLGGWSYSIYVSDTMIFVGGEFETVDGKSRRNIVSFLRSTGAPY